MPVEIQCPNCGASVQQTHAFCTKCGTRLEGQASGPATRHNARGVATLSGETKSRVSTAGEGRTVLQNNLLVPEPGQHVILIGRDPLLQNSGHCYLDHPAISLQHARLEKRGAQWFVVDLDSNKGTFVNYQRVLPGPEGIPVSEADVIWVAPYSFRLCTDGQRSTLQPAHMRLDAHGLRRVVKTGAREQAILDMRKTPLAFIPGEFIALVGGSGSGKSTLIKALNGLAPAQEGEILIDGHPIIAGGNARPFSALYSIVGYVPQDDIMYRELTVTELLQSVAHLRLADLTNVEIALTIDDTLDAVDLKEHSHKRISQLSGGQRKRVNIAMELLAQPRLLFLDEPTSGLDPGLDLEVMSLLRRWARGEEGNGHYTDPKTIVLVTHATENIELCDYIAFLEPGGRLAYFGPPREAKSFFFPECNPDQVSYSQLYRRVTEGPPDRTGGTSWADRYLGSSLYQRYVVDRTNLVLSQAQSSAQSEMQSQSRIPPQSTEPLRYRVQVALQQMSILARRQFIRTLRDRFNAIFMLLQPLFVAWLLSGVASEQALRPGRDAIDAQKVLFVLACAVVWLGVINATKAIVSEKDIYQRERRYGLGATPYVLSKVLVLGGIGVVQVLLLLIAMNWVLDLPREGVFLPIILEYGTALSLSLIAGLSLGLLISSLAHSPDMATTLMFVILIVQVVFSGLLFAPKGLAELPAALTVSRWSLRALGSSSDLNRLLSSASPIGYTWDADYKAEAGYLLQMWLVLMVYAVTCIGLTSWNEGRHR